MTSPEYTHPDTPTIGVAQGWADRETDPTTINWPQRQKHALIPYDVIDGQPISPFPGATWPRGRGQLGRWGENPMADAVVLAEPGNGERWILLIQRGQPGENGHGTWALPGGSIDPGESPAAAARRELEEETGLSVSEGWTLGTPRHVPDPRASDQAWAVTVPSFVRLDYLPLVLAPATDAIRAEWVLATNMQTLREQLADRFGGTVFTAHENLLTDILDHGLWGPTR